MAKAPSGAGLLLVLRRGGVWGIENAAVASVRRQRGDYRVEVRPETAGEAPATLVADEILGVVKDLEVWPAAAVLRRFWPESSGGLAVYGDVPIVVVDPRRLPRVLQSEEGEACDGQGRDS